MGLLKKVEKTLAYAKIGIFGFQGSGKSFTSFLIALGLCKHTNNPNVCWFDTETGSDFFAPMAEKEKLQLYQVKRRGFTDLLATVKECVSEKIGVLVVDSATHVWRDLCDSYDVKLNRRGRLQFQDWAIIKREWAQWTDAFINSPIHIIVCGRAGYEYDYDINEDGSKDLVKTGTRFKAEGEFGFEPSLVIEMERVTPGQEDLAKIRSMTDSRKRKEAKQLLRPGIGSGWIHRAHVLKDRTDTIDGQIFDDPGFDDFLPHFQNLNIGGVHLGVDTTSTTKDLFDSEGRPDWKIQAERKEILRAEIKATIDKFLPGTSAKEKRAKIILKEVCFGVRSDEGIDPLPLEKLQAGRDFLEFVLKKDYMIPALLGDSPVDFKPLEEEFKIASI